MVGSLFSKRPLEMISSANWPCRMRAAFLRCREPFGLAHQFFHALDLLREHGVKARAFLAPRFGRFEATLQIVIDHGWPCPPHDHAARRLLVDSRPSVHTE